jgi:hypothetical protein
MVFGLPAARCSSCRADVVDVTLGSAAALVSTCCELFVGSLYLLFNFVQSASIKYLGVIALLWVDFFAR